MISKKGTTPSCCKKKKGGGHFFSKQEGFAPFFFLKLPVCLPDMNVLPALLDSHEYLFKSFIFIHMYKYMYFLRIMRGSDYFSREGGGGGFK